MINRNEADGDAAECLSDSLISPFSEERLSTARLAGGCAELSPPPTNPPEDGVRGKEEEKEVTELQAGHR